MITRRFLFMPTQTSNVRKQIGVKKAGKQASKKSPGVDARVAALLDRFEKELHDKEFKPSITDYIRLLQFTREREQQDQPTDIEVTWIESLDETKRNGG
jgi:hypothetical protein